MVSGNFTAQAEELARLAAEPLHPDLEAWVEEDGPMGPMLRHPLVYNLTVRNMPGVANKVYADKRKMLAEAQAEQDWHSVVFCYERPYRFRALVDTVTGRDDLTGDIIPLSALGNLLTQDTLDLVADVWVDSENIASHIEDWRTLFGECDFFLGDEDERAAFDALPDPVTAYRAGIDDGDWSWSTKRSIAEFFARRFQDEPLPVVEALIPKARCFGYLTRRSEHELLVRLQ